MTATADLRHDAKRTDGRGDAAEAAAAARTRRCIVSGRVLPVEELIRFVSDPTGTVVPDILRRLPGRGLWLSAGGDIIRKACARNLFARAAKASLRVPEDLPDRVDRLLAQRCVELIGLARRAGQLTRGYEKVTAQIETGRASVLVQAADAAEGGRRKVAALAHAHGVPVIAVLSSAELNQALAGTYVHCAIAPGKLAQRLQQEARRLMAMRQSDDENGSSGAHGSPVTREEDDR